MPLVCRNKLTVAKSGQTWVGGKWCGSSDSSLQRSFSYIICCWPRTITQGTCWWPLGVDHVLFGTLKFKASCHSPRAKSSLGWHFSIQETRNIPYELEMNGGSAEIQFVSFIFLLSGKKAQQSHNFTWFKLHMSSSIFFF